jgi:hypothetical protein
MRIRCGSSLSCMDAAAHASWPLYSEAENKQVMRFELLATCPSTGARAGLLHTARRTAHTHNMEGAHTNGRSKGNVEFERDAQPAVDIPHRYFGARDLRR